MSKLKKASRTKTVSRSKLKPDVTGSKVKKVKFAQEKVIKYVDKKVQKKRKQELERKQEADGSEGEEETAEEALERQREERRKEKKRKKEEKKIRKAAERKAAGIEYHPAEEEKLDIHPALQYLRSWARKDGTWKFSKVRQVWLLKNMLDRSAVPKKEFKQLLSYISGMKGVARETTRQQAKAVLDRTDVDEESDRQYRKQCRRARSIIEALIDE